MSSVPRSVSPSQDVLHGTHHGEELCVRHRSWLHVLGAMHQSMVCIDHDIELHLVYLYYNKKQWDQEAHAPFVLAGRRHFVEREISLPCVPLPLLHSSWSPSSLPTPSFLYP